MQGRHLLIQRQSQHYPHPACRGSSEQAPHILARQHQPLAHYCKEGRTTPSRHGLNTPPLTLSQLHVRPYHTAHRLMRRKRNSSKLRGLRYALSRHLRSPRVPCCRAAPRRRRCTSSSVAASPGRSPGRCPARPACAWRRRPHGAGSWAEREATVSTPTAVTHSCSSSTELI